MWNYDIKGKKVSIIFIILNDIISKYIKYKSFVVLNCIFSNKIGFIF